MRVLPDLLAVRVLVSIKGQDLCLVDVYFSYNKGGTQIYFTDDSLECGLSRAVEDSCRPGFDPAIEAVSLEAGLQPGLRDEPEIESTHFSLSFDGARATVPVGADMAETRFNYHLGEQANWIDGVATYKTVVYNGLYDGIIVVHPNWWGQPPAVLKGWIDRVIRPGVAYEFVGEDGGEGVPRGLLKAQAALVFNTGNTTAQREIETFGDPLQAIWKDCIFALCGITYFYRRLFGIIITSSDQHRKAWLEDVAQTVDQFFPSEFK